MIIACRYRFVFEATVGTPTTARQSLRSRRALSLPSLSVALPVALMAPRLEHIVLLKTTRPYDEAEKAEVRRRLKLIPGVLGVSIGANYCARSQGHTVGIVVTLTDAAAEKAYQTHPEHVYVRDTILKPAFDASAAGPPVLAVDYVYDQPVCPIDWRGFVAAGALLGFVVGGLVARR